MIDNKYINKDFKPNNFKNEELKTYLGYTCKEIEDIMNRKCDPVTLYTDPRVIFKQIKEILK